MSSLPTVDIIIPARNEAQTLGRCLERLGQQSYPDSQIRVIVVNHRSGDDTKAIALSYGATVIEGDAQDTLGQLRNRGVTASDGLMIAFIDAHCLVPPTWLETMVDVMERPLLSGLVRGGVQGPLTYQCDDPKVKSYMDAAFAKTQGLGVFYNSLAAHHQAYPWIPTGNALYRRKAFESVGGFSPHFFRCEDVDLSWKVLMAGYCLESVDEACPQATVEHLESCDWTTFIHKHRDYGFGAAQLESQYQLSGLAPSWPLIQTLLEQGPTGWPALQLHWAFLQGYHHAKRTPKPSLPLSSTFLAPAKPTSQTPIITWQADQRYVLSPQLILWFQGDTNAGVIDPNTHQRYLFEDLAHGLWRLLLEGHDAEGLLAYVLTHYEVSETQARTDLEAFRSHLLRQQLLRPLPPKHALAEVSPESITGSHTESNLDGP